MSDIKDSEGSGHDSSANYGKDVSTQPGKRPGPTIKNADDNSVVSEWIEKSSREYKAATAYVLTVAHKIGLKAGKETANYASQIFDRAREKQRQRGGILTFDAAVKEAMTEDVIKLVKSVSPLLTRKAKSEGKEPTIQECLEELDRLIEDQYEYQQQP